MDLYNEKLLEEFLYFGSIFNLLNSHFSWPKDGSMCVCPQLLQACGFLLSLFLTLPTAEILSGKNGLYLKKKIKILKQKKILGAV